MALGLHKVKYKVVELDDLVSYVFACVNSN